VRFAPQLRVLQRRRAASGEAAPPFATVVTDLTSCHPTWFHPGVSACFVPTEEVASQARAAGLAPRQIVMHGLPIRPAFAAPLPARPALRKRLGLHPEGAVILLVGGGEGMGLLEPTAVALGARLPPTAQVVVVCGRNAALAARLASRTWPCRMVVKGFVSNMDEWMGASDLVITKAGPGTIAEALIRGVPLMLNGAIPCQEEGNVPYVLDNGVGRFSTDPKAIATQVAAWCGPAAAELAGMARKAKALGRPNATFCIVKDLAALTV
jgi:1,2-diacylglycerol 3-beta-galactosyltransferase